MKWCLSQFTNNNRNKSNINVSLLRNLFFFLDFLVIFSYKSQGNFNFLTTCASPVYARMFYFNDGATKQFLNIKILNWRISCSFFFCISFRIELNTQIKHIRKCHLFSRFTFFLFLVCSWWEEKCILLVEFQLMCCEIMKFIAAFQPKFNMLFNFIEVLEYYGLLSIVSMAKIKVHFYRFDIRPNDFCKNNFSEQLFVTYTYILHRIESVWSGDTLHISNPPFKR